jgi:hypothetical protein
MTTTTTKRSGSWIYITEYGDALLIAPTDQTLSDLQSLVGGYVECVAATKDQMGFACDVWVNEEGLFRNDFGFNLVASFMTGRQLIGPAVICTSDAQGNTCGLTEKNITRLLDDGLMIDDNHGDLWTPSSATAFRFPVA